MVILRWRSNLVITVIRNIIEPKLVGKQVGLPPVLTLAGMLLYDELILKIHAFSKRCGYIFRGDNLIVSDGFGLRDKSPSWIQAGIGWDYLSP
jgi:hypothetical protein